MKPFVHLVFVTKIEERLTENKIQTRDEGYVLVEWRSKLQYAHYRVAGILLCERLADAMQSIFIESSAVWNAVYWE